MTSIELCAWLGGLQEHKASSSGSFLTIEEVGKFLESTFILSVDWIMWSCRTHLYFLPPPVPVNLKEQDAFHLTIEEYLLALISVVEELVSS